MFISSLSSTIFLHLHLSLWLVYAFQSLSRFQISAIFEPFLRAYYENFKYKSIDSYQFKEFFLDYFKDKDTSGINWDQWFYTPGMPKYKPNFDESLAKVRTRKQYDNLFLLFHSNKLSHLKEDNENLRYFQVCSELKEKWVKWNPADSSPFTESDLANFTSGQKVEFLGQLLEEEPLRYEFYSCSIMKEN